MIKPKTFDKEGGGHGIKCVRLSMKIEEIHFRGNIYKLLLLCKIICIRI